MAAALVFFLFKAPSSEAQNPVAQGADVVITPDVVYGHKDGMALTFDVFQPNENPKDVGVLFMVMRMQMQVGIGNLVHRNASTIVLTLNRINPK